MKKKDRKTKKQGKIQEKKLVKELSQEWDSSLVKESRQNWTSYSESKQAEILAECEAIFAELAEFQDKGVDSPEVKELLVRWHQFLQHFYEPSLEVLRGLGFVYADDQRFREKFASIDPHLPDFLKAAINSYVDELENIWLQEQYEVLEHTNEL